jgi:hypothetical protein
MPHELALDLGYFDRLSVELSGDARAHCSVKDANASSRSTSSMASPVLFGFVGDECSRFDFDERVWSDTLGYVGRSRGRDTA